MRIFTRPFCVYYMRLISSARPASFPTILYFSTPTWVLSLHTIQGRRVQKQTRISRDFPILISTSCGPRAFFLTLFIAESVPTATQVDPDSGDEIVTNNLGTMIITTRDGSTRTVRLKIVIVAFVSFPQVVFPDHTRIITERLGGQEERITISKLGTPLCSISRTDSSEMVRLRLGVVVHRDGYELWLLSFLLLLLVLVCDCSA